MMFDPAMKGGSMRLEGRDLDLHESESTVTRQKALCSRDTTILEALFYSQPQIVVGIVRVNSLSLTRE